MLYSKAGLRGAVSAPHHLAAQTGRDILREGGCAIEAMVGMAATIAVVYPHMNGIGGDGFWLIRKPDGHVLGIEACGRAAAAATPDLYLAGGHLEIPTRGPRAALTVPGAVDGWRKALEYATPEGTPMPLSRLFTDAVALAKEGVVVTENQSQCTEQKLDELLGVPGFQAIYAAAGRAPAALSVLRQPALGDTFLRLAKHGLNDFYRGDLAAAHGRCCTQHGSPLTSSDFAEARAEKVTPLSLRTEAGELFNLPPPTQGVSSLMILGIFERLGITQGEGFEHIHGLVEATKQAFRLRNRGLGDPDTMSESASDWLQGARLDELAGNIDRTTAAPWPDEPSPGDTIWMGAADAGGTVVSYIQSVYWEFGSGFCCPETGVVFQNRGAGFSLQPGPNQLAPGKRPFHTLNPAMARLRDGRVMAYGNMGGEGQPQSQSALFSRYALFGRPLQAAITAPRWLLGRTWGDSTTSLKLESRFDPDLVERLRSAGHDVEMLGPYSDLVGHAGAVVVHPTGVIETASDPRCDGAAVAL